MNESSLQGTPTDWPADSTPSNGSAAAFDCFNDDLVWILDKLVDRSGASLGLLSGHVRGEAHHTILARDSHASDVSEHTYHALARSAATGFGIEPRRRSDDAAEVMLQRFTVSAAGKEEHVLQCLQLRFSPAPNVSVVATVCKPDSLLGGFNVLHRSTAARLYPVMSRYVRLWWLHRAERRLAGSLSAALNLSDVGIMLLDRRGELVFANSRAASFLQQEDGLRRQEASIGATHLAEGAKLRAVIEHAIHCNLRQSSPATSHTTAPILPLRRANDRRPLIATVMHVERAAVDPRDPAVIVYVLDPEQSVEELLGPVCRLYKLTAVETRLVYLLVDGHRLADAAKQLRVQFETARAYLKQIFLKTQTHRQVDLVRVMLASAMRTSAKVELSLL